MNMDYKLEQRLYPGGNIPENLSVQRVVEILFSLLRRNRKSFLHCGIVISLLIVLHSCWYYSFSGALPSHLNSIAIPLFDDRTAYPNIRENLSNKVIDTFIADNRLKVTNEDMADLILTGTISSISEQAAAVSAGEVVTEYRVVVSVRVKCEDLKLAKVLYDKTIQNYGLMPAQGGIEERDKAIEEALELITEDILNSTFSIW